MYAGISTAIGGVLTLLICIAYAAYFQNGIFEKSTTISVGVGMALLGAETSGYISTTAGAVFIVIVMSFIFSSYVYSKTNREARI